VNPDLTVWSQSRGAPEKINCGAGILTVLVHHTNDRGGLDAAGRTDMATSQNGWPAGDTAALDKTFASVGVGFPGGVRQGDVSTVLGYVATQFNQRVEALVQGWCWGYSYRPVKGATSLSNHASGTAIDMNAPNHPLGKKNTYSAAQRDEIHRILGEVGGVVRWGGDYSGRVDEMHFEINANAASVADVARRLPAHNPLTARIPMMSEDEPMLVPAAADDYVSVPCNGATALFISTGFSRKVKVLGIAAVRDNNGTGAPSYAQIEQAVDINPDQPGPIAIGPGCRVVQLRYSADHAFTVWCA
jgi:hypothetical protein